MPQCSVAARCTPTGIGETPLANQIDDFSRHGGPAQRMAALPAPIPPESSSLPSNPCFGFDDPECRSPVPPQLPEPDESVGDTETEFARTGRALQDQELMPKGKDFYLERGPSPQTLSHRKKQPENGCEHGIEKRYR